METFLRTQIRIASCVIIWNDSILLHVMSHSHTLSLRQELLRFFWSFFTRPNVAMTKITTLIHFHATETSYSLDNVAIGGDAINKELNLYLVAKLRTRPFLSALPVIQVVWSCPLRSCPTERTVAQIKILCDRKSGLTDWQTAEPFHLTQ